MSPSITLAEMWLKPDTTRKYSIPLKTPSTNLQPTLYRVELSYMTWFREKYVDSPAVRIYMS